MIKPTVGRVVWFYPANSKPNDQPLAAIVTAVSGDRCVNLAIFERNGVPMSHPPTSVTLLQDDDQAPIGLMHCRWMPYQISQAAKSEGARAVAPIVPGPVTNPANLSGDDESPVFGGHVTALDG